MRNYVIINGVNSLTIQGLAINNLPPITKPMIRTQREEIDGRDGDIVTELGYSAYDKQIEIGLWGNYDINDIIKYFTGEGTIVFSNEEDKYYNFKILDQIDYEKLLKFKTATITLHCQPFKYPLEEEPVEAEITTLTGTGETITLNNTKEAPMKIDLKGNTSQATTTGKNLLDLSSFTTTTQSGITLTPTFKNGELLYITSSGIYGGTVTYITLINTQDISPNTQYILSGAYSGSARLRLREFDSNNTQLSEYFDEGSSVSFTTKSNVDHIIVQCVFYATNNVKFYPMLRLASITDDIYEPYTNGASPNPDYPQDIHVVSGDNSIIVVGKNLYNSNDTTFYQTCTYVSGANTNQYKVKATGADVIINSQIASGTSYSSIAGTLISCKYGETIYYDTGNSNFGKNIVTQYNSNKVSLGFSALNTGSSSGSYTPTNSECEYISIRIGYGSATSGTEYTLAPIFSKSSNLTYEPYIGNTYPIYLGVENYLPNNATTQTINGITYTINEDKSIKINGTASGRADIYLYGSNTDTGSYTYIPKGTYTIDTSNLLDGTMFLQFREKTAGVVYQTKQNNGLLTLLSQQDCYFYGIMLAVENGKTINNLTFYPQIEKGTKLNSYTPYGTTPIELCKIGDYQDIIKKSTGKNLFDKSMVFLNKMITGTGSLIDFTGIFSSDYIKVKPSTTYYVNEYIPTIVAFDKDKSSLGYIRNASGATTFATPNNCEYIRVRMFDASIDMTTALNNAMLSLGSSATTYEPYGTGWYVKKEIGKVVFTGGNDETWNISETSTSGSNRFLNESIANLVTKPSADSVTINTLSNNFVAKSANQTYLNQEGIDISKIGNLHIYSDTTKNYTVAQFKTWLNTHNTIIYYPLATPTITEITDSTLLSQLNALEQAQSKDNQTNINQANNDLPFELDVSVTFVIPMEINNIGNIYAKPILTIEGTGNIGVVLNDIQILEIDLTNNGKITIDVTKLEAYNPDDDTLLNRLVTGDYMKLLINEGENTIKFTGSVSSATLTNYIRWI